MVRDTTYGVGDSSGADHYFTFSGISYSGKGYVFSVTGYGRRGLFLSVVVYNGISMAKASFDTILVELRAIFSIVSQLTKWANSVAL